jgi:RNA-directed DNA polymerase
MEQVLKDWIVTKPNYHKRRGSEAKKRALTVVRYADDFVIIHPVKEVVVEAKEILSQWLASTSGLRFNEDKTTILDTNQGFGFLGHQFINVKRNGKQRIKIYPSKKSCARLQSKLRDIIQHNKAASSYDLIKKLRPVILGWANYFCYCECSETFSKMDNLLFLKLRAWVFRRDRRNGRIKIKEKYFPSWNPQYFNGVLHEEKWILVGKGKTKAGKNDEVFLPRMSWVTSKHYVKVKGTASVYDGNDTYWISRVSSFGKMTASKKKLYLDQNGECPWCGNLITGFDIVEVDHIVPLACGGKNVYSNLQLLHKHCHVAKTRSDGSSS